ncbi:hypothetical protein GJV76_04880 [Myroides sp. BIT-d1]|uniref:Uncharacterized protein n=1 Tax=Myroides albus TaxID=2562892 RepID=A0A6I3LI50_9FLAO|nr:hypothetical protein [Myroides albus]MTG97474.1 hypothetical protein [Myroides albus]
MKKYVIFLLIGGSVFGQEVEVKKEIEWARDFVQIGNTEYIQYKAIENDSLQIEKIVSNFADTNTSVETELEAIKLTDSVTELYIYRNNKHNTLFYGIYERGAIVEGLVLDSLSFVGGNNRYHLYANREVQKTYYFDLDKHYFSFLEASVGSNNKVLDYYYSLPPGAISPFILSSKQDESEVNDEGFEKVVYANQGKEIIYFFSKTEDNFRIKVTEQGKVAYYIVSKQAGNIFIENIEYDLLTKEEGYLNKASIVNVGFAQKRATTITEKGKGIWDAYFEEFLESKWNEKGQLVYDYRRGNEKKNTRMRVVVGKNIEENSLLYNLVVSFINNPELFRRDLTLRDFDYSNVNSTKTISLKSKKDQKYELVTK